MLFPPIKDAVVKMAAFSEMAEFSPQLGMLEMHYICVDSNSVPALLQ
jgi:hypothetical protein